MLSAPSPPGQRLQFGAELPERTLCACQVGGQMRPGAVHCRAWLQACCAVWQRPSPPRAVAAAWACLPATGPAPASGHAGNCRCRAVPADGQTHHGFPGPEPLQARSNGASKTAGSKTARLSETPLRRLSVSIHDSTVSGADKPQSAMACCSRAAVAGRVWLARV